MQLKANPFRYCRANRCQLYNVPSLKDSNLKVQFQFHLEMFNKIRKFFRRKYNNNEIIAEETGFYEKRKAKSAKASKRSSPNEKKNPFLSAPSSRRGSGKVQ